MVIVATFETMDDAEPLQQRLQQLGIPAEIHHESKLQTFWMSHEHAVVRVKVRNEDMGNVKILLNDWDHSEGVDVLEKACRWPNCNSHRVRFPQYTRKFITPGI